MTNSNYLYIIFINSKMNFKKSRVIFFYTSSEYIELYIKVKFVCSTLPKIIISKRNVNREAFSRNFKNHKKICYIKEYYTGKSLEKNTNKDN